MIFRAPFPRVVITLCWVLITLGTALANDDVSLSFQEKDRVYGIQGVFSVEAETSVAWDVLTGYEHIPQFVNSLKRSHVLEDLGVYHFLLEQEFEGGFLFITKRVKVVLDVHEVWYQTIAFEDVSHGDFEYYRGSWELEPAPGGKLKVTYTLSAKQNFDLPFSGDYMRGGVKDLLNSVRQEIIRRQARELKERTPVSTPGRP